MALLHVLKHIYCKLSFFPLEYFSASQQKAVNKKDEEDTEDDPRRAARVAEQASRSARLLYSLQQQVTG